MKATSPDTKTRVLSAAVALFSERGFSAVSMREIAGAVGISAPALYNHYPSKEALYRAAVSQTFADKAPALLEVLNCENPPMQRLRRFLSLVAEAVREDPHFRALMQRELLDGDRSRLDFIARMVFSPLQGPLVDLLEELRPGGDAFLLSELIFGMITQHDEMHLLHPYLDRAGAGPRPPEAIADLVMEVLTPYLSGARS